MQRKGFDAMLKTLIKLNKEFPNFLYLIIGEGEYKKQLLKKLTLPEYKDINQKVKFLGNVADQDLACYFKIADIFAMPSRRLSSDDVEGFGIVFLEANLFGKPVIGGDSGGIRDAVLDGETGFLVDPRDINMIKNAVLKLLTNSEKAKQMGELGKQRVFNEFQWAIQTKKLEKLLTD